MKICRNSKHGSITIIEILRRLAVDAEDIDEDEIQCPICDTNSECEHLLAIFDVTFPDEGKLGAGLVGGELYKHSDIDELLEQIRMTAITDYKIGNNLINTNSTAPKNTWLLGSEGLEHYYNEVCYDAPNAEEIEGADVASAWSHITNHGDAVRECIRLLIEEDLSGHIFILNSEIDERPGCSSNNEYWYADEPKVVVNELNKYIERRLLKRNTQT